MAERIYTRDEQGKLEPLEEAPFASEDDLQALLAEHPELLDGEQMRPGDPRRWILIKREKGIAETSDAGDRWALDHLLIDQDATPTLVEVKRGANSEVRRKVVGQMLEYAAHATGGAGSWAVDDIRRDFEDNANAQDRNPDDLIADLLQTDGEPDVEAFWKDVGANLAARRIRLLFVADDIPDSLTRIVSFLNEQTRDNIEVLAVEIKQFSGKSTQTLVPTRHWADRGRPSEERPAHQANARVVLGRVHQRRSTGRCGAAPRHGLEVRRLALLGFNRRQYPDALSALESARHRRVALPLVENILVGNEELHVRLGRAQLWVSARVGVAASAVG